MKKDIYIIILFILSMSAFSSDIDDIFNKDFNYIKVIIQTDEVLLENDKMNTNKSTDPITLYQKEYTIFRKDNEKSIGIDSPQLDGVFYEYDSKILSLTERSFYTKLIAYWSEDKKRVMLYSVDNSNNLTELNLTGIEPNYNYIFDVSSIEPIDSEYKYIMVIGRSYYYSEFKDYDNFIAIVRKKDLKYKVYKVDNSVLKNINFSFNQYSIENYKLRIELKQKNNFVIDLIFSHIKKNYLTPTVNNLRFRATPTLNGRFIRHLKAGEQLEFIERGKSETIGDVKGTWVKVKTGQGEVGWCFDAYLKEVK